MTSIVCPKCKSHLSEWNLSCINCGLTVTEELREQLIREKQIQREMDTLKDISPQVRAMKLDRKYKLQKALNTYSFGLFKTGFAEIVVPVLIVVLIIIAITFMFLK